MAKQKMDYQQTGEAKMAKMKAEAKLEGEPVDEESAEHMQPGGDTDDTSDTLKGQHLPEVSLPVHHVDALQSALSRSGHKMHPEDAMTLQNHVHMLRGAAHGMAKQAKVKLGGM